MQVHNNTSNFNSNQKFPASSGKGGKGSDKMASEINSVNKQANEPLRPMRTYKGHGMLEQYPANLTVAYVSGHESRHAHGNRSQAAREGQHVDQNISFNVKITSDGKAMASGGVTRSRLSSKDAPEIAKGKGQEGLLSPEAFEKKIKEFHLARKKESLEKELYSRSDKISKENRGSLSNNYSEADSSLTAFSDERASAIRENIEKVNLKRKITSIDGEKKQLSRTERLGESLEQNAPDPEGKKSGGPEINQVSLPEEEHVDLSRVAPSSYHFAKRGIPNAMSTHGFGSAFELNNILNLTERFDASRSTPDNINFLRKEVREGVDSLSTLASRFDNLKVVTNDLAKSETLNVRTSKSSFVEAVSSRTSVESPLGKYQVSVQNLALPHKIVSDQYSDPYAELGLSGSFKINGYQVDVDTTDSLNSIKDMINFGEDVNENGSLDYSEDLNGNGTLDSTQIDNDGRRIYEDIDFDGALDASEDANGNELLDGGTARLGVRADIQDNRLTIQTVKTGNHSLTIDDTDDILLNIGFFFEDTSGQSRLKDHFDSSTSEQINSKATQANFSINGANLERASNNVKNVIPDTTLVLKQVTGTPVNLEIKNNIKPSRAKIEKFAEEYNASVTGMNNFLAFKKTLHKNAVVQNVRQRLTERVHQPVKSLSQNHDSVKSIGLKPQNTEKRQVSAFSVRHAMNSVLKNKKPVSSFRAQGDNTISSTLRQLGIKTRKDDTLEIDQEHLSSVLSDTPAEVSRIFTDKNDGVSARLDTIFKDTQGKQGTLDLAKARMNAQVFNLSKLKKTFSASGIGDKILKSGNPESAKKISVFA